MADLIDLDRQFAPIGVEHAQLDEQSARLVDALTRRSDADNWDAILKRRRVVLFGDAGSGKTAEFQRVSAKLEESGKLAFFVRLDEAGSASLLDLVDADRYQVWRDGSDEAWFFLDSVDESKIRDPADFRIAVRKIASALAPNLDRAKIIVSARKSGWDWRADLTTISDAFCPRQGGDQEREAFELIEILPLERRRRRKLVQIKLGVENCEAMLGELDRSGLEDFAERPGDLIGLCDQWQSAAALGTLWDITEASIRRLLRDPRPETSQRSPIGDNQARRGAEQLALVMTLLQRGTLPLEPEPGLLSASEVLADWKPNERSALFQRPVFEAPYQNRLRFHRSAFREFLAATALEELCRRRGLTQHALSERVFSTCYGETTLRPSMRPVAAWLAASSEPLRERMIEISPEALAGSGDPKRLPPIARRRILKQVIERLLSQHPGAERLSAAQCRRFAGSDLAEPIADYLSTHSQNADANFELFLLASAAPSEETSKIALRTLTTESLEFRDGFGAAIACAADAVRGAPALRDLLLSPKSQLSAKSASHAASELFPDNLSVPELLVLLGRAAPGKQYATSGWGYVLKYSIVPRASVVQLRELAVGLSNWLQENHLFVGLFEYRKLERPLEWRCEMLHEILEEILAREVDIAPEADLVFALSVIQEGKKRSDHYGPLNNTSIRNQISENRPLSRALLSADVERACVQGPAEAKRPARFADVLHGSNLWTVSLQDYAFVRQQMHAADGREESAVWLDAAIFVLRRYAADDLEAWSELEREAQSLGLETEFAQFVAPPASVPEQSPGEPDRQRLEQAEKRQEGHDAIQNLINDPIRRAKLETGDESEFGALSWAAREMLRAEKGRSRYGAPEIAPVREFAGEEAAAAFSKGLRAFWRRFDPRPHRFNSVAGVEVGLCGLAHELALTPATYDDWSAEHVERAVAFAPFELNGLPDWLDQLVMSRPAEALPALRNEIDAEIRAPQSDVLYWAASRLSDLDRQSPFFASVAPVCVDAWLEMEPRTPPVLRRLLSVVVTFARQYPDNIDLAAIASTLSERTTLDNEADLECGLLNLVAWLCTDPDRAIVFLSSWINAAESADEAASRLQKLAQAWNSGFSEWRPLSPTEALTPSAADALFRLAEPFAESTPLPGAIELDDGTLESDQRLPDVIAQLAEASLRALGASKSSEAVARLCAIAEELPLRPWRKQQIRSLAHERALLDGDVPWQPHTIARDLPRWRVTPITQDDVFFCVTEDILDIADQVQNGDASQAEIVRRACRKKADEPVVEVEKLVQLFLHDQLRMRALDRYNIERETEDAAGKKPDFHAAARGPTTAVPIEVKVAENWSDANLISALPDQLAEYYLRDTNHRRGVFVVARARQGSVRKIRDRSAFIKLVSCLQNEADAICRGDQRFEAIRVIGIDFFLREQKLGS